jgi:plastocyanin
MLKIQIAVMAVLLAAAPITPSLTGAAAKAATPGKAVTIKIANFDFGPKTITVPAGAAVTWVNADEDAHSVVADNNAFRSPALDTGDHYSFTYTTPGTYGYHCGLHPQMVGKVIVTR